MGTEFKVRDVVYVSIKHSSGLFVLYEGLATVRSLNKDEDNALDIVFIKNGREYTKYVYTDGTDGDIIRHATKLDKHLLGVE